MTSTFIIVKNDEDKDLLYNNIGYSRYIIDKNNDNLVSSFIHANYIDNILIKSQLNEKSYQSRVYDFDLSGQYRNITEQINYLKDYPYYKAVVYHMRNHPIKYEEAPLITIHDKKHEKIVIHRTMDLECTGNNTIIVYTGNEYVCVEEHPTRTGLNLIIDGQHIYMKSIKINTHRDAMEINNRLGIVKLYDAEDNQKLTYIHNLDKIADCFEYYDGNQILLSYDDNGILKESSDGKTNYEVHDDRIVSIHPVYYDTFNYSLDLSIYVRETLKELETGVYTYTRDYYQVIGEFLTKDSTLE